MFLNKEKSSSSENSRFFNLQSKVTTLIISVRSASVYPMEIGYEERVELWTVELFPFLIVTDKEYTPNKKMCR